MKMFGVTRNDRGFHLKGNKQAKFHTHISLSFPINCDIEKKKSDFDFAKGIFWNNKISLEL
jgi:hypothetical protein